MEARSLWDNTLKMIKEKNQQPHIYTQQNYPSSPPKKAK